MRTYLILAIIAAALVGGSIYTVFIYGAGEKGIQAKQAVAQVKHDRKVKTAYDKIDKQTPYGGNDAAVAAFLLSHAAADQ